MVVKNNGSSVAETFNVTAYYDTNEIDMQAITNLAAGANKTVTFTWNTTSLEAGNYTIKAVAETVIDETNITNNALTNGKVQVKEPISPEGPITIPWTWITIAAVIIVIAIAAAYLTKRKKL